MRVKRWLGVLGAGLLAGLVAALAMTLLMTVLRFVFGVPSPSELVGERIVPALPYLEFFALLERWGGYNNLKRLGVGSVLGGQLVVGLLGGLIYAVTVEIARARNPQRTWRWRIHRAGWIVVAVLVTSAFSASLVVLWPTLPANFRGLPPGAARAATIVGLLIAYLTYGVTLAWGYHTLTTRIPVRHPAPVGASPIGRRVVLVAGVGVVAALAAGGLIERLRQLATFSYDGKRYVGPNVEPITPNDAFYSVTKNIVDPSVLRAAWRLEITGMVEQPRTYTYDDLVAMPAVQQETTLQCISNFVGDGLMSNAMWTGVPLQSLIEAARPLPGAIEVLLSGADGYTDTFAYEKALDPTTLVVYGMNGAPLPERNGYPARVIVPGLFGEKNVKWVTRIALIDYDHKGFYEQQGWGPNFQIPISSRFDVPRPEQNAQFVAGQAFELRGVAFAGNKGIGGVEISTDNGQSWQRAEITYPGTQLTWAHWRFMWMPAERGEYRLVVRATDANGTLQTATERGIAPEGATGYHRVSVNVA